MFGLPKGGVNEFLWSLSSQAGVRPAGAYGGTITPGTNTLGTTVSLITGSSVTDDVWWIAIHLNSNGTPSAVVRDMLVNVVIDPAGGTSWGSPIIPNLGCSGIGSLLGNNTNGGGTGSWLFPLHIPAGASIGVNAQVNNATVGTVRIWCQLWGRPTRPDLCCKGTFVETLGANTGTSKGTDVNVGTTSDGTWTSLGTTANDLWWWQLSQGSSDTSLSALVDSHDLAVGDASNKRVVLWDYRNRPATDETVSPRHAFVHQSPVALMKAGTIAYGRGQSSSTANSNIWMLAHGVGGMM